MAAVDSYIAQNYAWATDNSDMQSLLQDMNARMNEAVAAETKLTQSIDSNTSSTDANTEGKVEFPSADEIARQAEESSNIKSPRKHIGQMKTFIK